VLYVHPFAEEMNKARRMAALQARALAAAGWAVLQVDLLGCGDSSGDFGDATWDDWVADVADAAAWLRSRHDGPLWLWGLRAGTLLARAALDRIATPCALLLWNPTPSGRQLLQQFMRLKMAAELLDGRHKGAIEALRQQLARGEPVEVAGYGMNPALAAGLEGAVLAPPPLACRVEWLEVQRAAPATLTPVAVRTADDWARAGAAVRASAVTGPAFWQSAEIEDAPALLAATLAALDAPALAAGMIAPAPNGLAVDGVAP
jgi:exosortase A-associated hydrolase 2